MASSTKRMRRLSVELVGAGDDVVDESKVLEMARMRHNSSTNLLAEGDRVQYGDEHADEAARDSSSVVLVDVGTKVVTDTQSTGSSSSDTENDTQEGSGV